MWTRPKLVLISIITLVLISTAMWLWWNRPHIVDMTAYVPADSLVYLEAHNLPEIASGITATEGWQRLAPLVGLGTGFEREKWLSRVVAWTGIGPADAVVLSRAQIAVTVLSVDAAEASSDTLRIKPRAALVVETHTGQQRVEAAVEKLVGNLARRAYGNPAVSRKQQDEAVWTTWTASGGRRQIVAAVADSVAIIGNDEAAVEACLAVKRGERPSLLEDESVRALRGQVGGDEALTFGYVSPLGSAKLMDVVATVYAGQLSPNPRVQSVAAVLLPQLANRILGGAAWTARLAAGVIEDRYFLRLRGSLGERLRDALNPSNETSLSASELLPSDAYQLTCYTYQDPGAAWRGLSATISSQLDALSAPLVTRFLGEALRPYGIEAPIDFLSAIGPGIATARLDEEGYGSTVVITQVRDRSALREQVRRRLGANPRTERIGDAEMLISATAERGAASFIDDHLLLGSAVNLRRCLAARAAARTLRASGAFDKATTRRLSSIMANDGAASSNPPGAVTYTDDRAAAHAFISFIARQRAGSDSPAGSDAVDTLGRDTLGRALDEQPLYAISETHIVEGGIERRTRSAFGQFATFAQQFSFDGSDLEARRNRYSEYEERYKSLPNLADAGGYPSLGR